MAKFQTLVDIYQNATIAFSDLPLFGTKRDGEWSWMTYREFGRKTDGLRAGLAALGLSRGDHVGIIANNRYEWAAAAYACFGLGIAFIPMYEAQLPTDWEFIVRDSEIKALFVATNAIYNKTRNLLEVVPSLKHIISFDAATMTSHKTLSFHELAETAPTVPMIPITSTDVACIIYTSGTTGNPRGVILSHGNIASNVSAIHECFPMATNDRSLSFLPWAHSFGQTVELHALFSMGSSLAIAEGVDKILQNLVETKPTLLFSVPRIFNKLYAAVQAQVSEKPGFVQDMVKSALGTRKKQRNHEKVSPWERLVLALTDKVVFSKVRARFGGQLKYAFSGGAAIATEVAEFIDGLGITVYEGYGLTETSPIVTANWPHNRKIGSVGKALPGVTVTISDEGEVVTVGPNVMVGYYKRKEDTDAVLTKEGAFRTGDLGRLDDEGYLYITGRLKEQYKLENGKYVVPTLLEEQLKLSPYVANVMVYGDNKPFNVAIVIANMEKVKSWAAQHGVPDGGAKDILGSTRVYKLFQDELTHYGEKFKGFESVKDFALVADDFTVENGMLTPSLKVKRREVYRVYRPMIEELYAHLRKQPVEKIDRKEVENSAE
ncbi:MAG: long-chain fatty acid--CoA ligase [Polyangiaceae bacterium]|nr:long-chain fatty acid--CoA ligase [Polyangiaceae bacterium]